MNYAPAIPVYTVYQPRLQANELQKYAVKHAMSPFYLLPLFLCLSAHQNIILLFFLNLHTETPSIPAKIFFLKLYWKCKINFYLCSPKIEVYLLNWLKSLRNLINTDKYRFQLQEKITRILFEICRENCLNR